ncbi:hypothetical protein CCACVL1_15836 [Corchorus capsularis]|uniref:non-specific serine/threonine protein kinase n=1 Tax=Corchorus capsularis TaxID=210143 RepID=A0A1R3I0X3_COCAP|nr:hypothetical protein CCACVL1_15836 [Corchorus capsularis]
MEKKGAILMNKFELGRLLGQGTFAKVYHARNLTTGQSYAIKVIDKEKILRGGLIDQIKREISVMRLVRHPNVVRVYEVMASKTKIYFVMEYVKGGELFNKVAKGFLPFHDQNLMEMYRKISKGEFKCPQWIQPEVRKLLSKILDPYPSHRITVAKLMENCWFKKGYKHIDTPPPSPHPRRHSDIHAVFDSSESESCSDENEALASPSSTVKPSAFNAFDIISLSQGFDLSGLFEKDLNQRDCSRFTSRKPATDIVSKFEEIAQTESFSIKNKDGKVKLEGNYKEGRKGALAIDAEIFEVTPSFYVVELKKSSGDTLEYKHFCNEELKPSLNDIVWAWQGTEQQQQQKF